MTRLLTIFSLALLLAAPACGGDDDGDGSNDAPNLPDAGATPDAAPTGVVGLGQKCASPAECPAGTPACLGDNPSATYGYCTAECATGVVFTSTADGKLPMDLTLPAGSDEKCAAQFSATGGVPLCLYITGLSPEPPSPMTLAPDTEYTSSWSCGIVCDASMACPTGWTCNATTKICDQD